MVFTRFGTDTVERSESNMSSLDSSLLIKDKDHVIIQKDKHLKAFQVKGNRYSFLTGPTANLVFSPESAFLPDYRSNTDSLKLLPCYWLQYCAVFRGNRGVINAPWGLHNHGSNFLTIELQLSDRSKYQMLNLWSFVANLLLIHNQPQEDL